MAVSSVNTSRMLPSSSSRYGNNRGSTSRRDCRARAHMLRIAKLPESVLNTVEPDFDEVEVVPLEMLQKVPHDCEVLVAHRINLVFEPVFSVGTEAFDITG